MSKQKELPKGLQEYRSSLSDMEYCRPLLKRLQDLSEFGMRHWMNEHLQLIEEVAEADEALRIAKRKAISKAEDIFDECLKHWTIKEIQEATGYDDE